VGCFDEELPGSVYVGLVAMVGAFVDGDADVEIARWVGVSVVKLEFIISYGIGNGCRSNLPLSD
jgi:hypothetical protein